MIIYPIPIGNNKLAEIDIPFANTNTDGILSHIDWNTFNNKLDANRGNYIINSDAEIDTSGWNLYNDIGRTANATLINQDITYTSVTAGDAGNGINIEYTFENGYPASNPHVVVISPTHIKISWYNGPTLANNPTATQLKAAYDAVPGAVAIATSIITGNASALQYEVGSMYLTGGGDTFPVDGAGGTVDPGVTFTRSLINPLNGIASFLFSKDANSREGTGVSTDININNIDLGNELQINIAYKSSNMTFGTNSDVRIFIYDITNNNLINVVPKYTLTGPVGIAKIFIGTFQSVASSFNYRLILHIATANTNAWDLQFDDVVINSSIDEGEPTKVPSVVLNNQPVSGSVTDHMAVAWPDGATQWVPATSIYNGDPQGLFGFAVNIVGGFADIYIKGVLDGFSFGPFAGYNQFVDPALPGGLTPYPWPLSTSQYLIMGKGISATELLIQPYIGFANITGKGRLLTSADGLTDINLNIGSNGQVLTANSTTTSGLKWDSAIVTSAPLSYIVATRSLSIATASNTTVGVMSAADHSLLHASLTLGTANGLSLSTQQLSLTAATTTLTGALTSTDYNTFNNKEPAIGLKNTAFNKNYGANTSDVKMNDGVSVGSVDAIARIDHIHPVDTSRAASSHTQAESTIIFTDITTGNVSNLTHGYFPKISGTPGNFIKIDNAGTGLTYAAITGGGDMLASNNLSDVENITTARNNLQLVSNYRTILHGQSSHIAAKSAGTYALASADPAAISGTGTLYNQALIYIDSNDYVTVNGIPPVMRLKTMLLVNNVAPTGNFTFGLYPVTRPSPSGGAGLNILTLDSVVANSTCIYTTPSIANMTMINTSDFAIPSNGFYVLGVLTTATVAASSLVWLYADLQIKNA